ncbi:MAG: Gfo/Idh/MocA family protein [Acidimicrobiia bacterium]
MGRLISTEHRDSQLAVGAVVVGTGFGCLTHVRALRAAGFEVHALVGRDPNRTAERAKRFEIPHALTSLADAVVLPGVDAVTIATPPLTHAPLALEAIAAGKHVLCEKPFARDAAEARRLLDAAEAAGVVHLLGTEFRWATGQALLARVVAEGAIGAPRLATFLLHIPLLADPAGQVPDWWSDADQGGGWLGAHAAHAVDQIRVTLGEFQSVSAGLPRLAERGWTAEDTYSVHFRLRTGVEGLMQSTAADWGPFLVATRMAGAKGTAWLEGDAVMVADRSGSRAVDVPDDLRLGPPDPPPGDLLVTAYDMLHSMGIDLAPYTRLAETFRDLISHSPIPPDPRPATFADGVASMVVLDAIRRSAAAGGERVLLDPGEARDEQ